MKLEKIDPEQNWPKMDCFGPCYVEFLADYNGKTILLLGSDGVRHIDGRLSLENAVKEGRRKASQISLIHPKVVGFNILYKGKWYKASTKCT
jgi:hypothetical protein